MNLTKTPLSLRLYIFLFLLMTAFSSVELKAQLITVGNEGEMTILGGTDFSIDQLVIKPDRDYSIRNNSISIDPKRQFNSGRTISKTYIFENNPQPYKGKLMLGLNDDISDAEFSIHIFDNLRWMSLPSKKEGLGNGRMHAILSSNSLARAITVGANEGIGNFKILTNPVLQKQVSVDIKEEGEYIILSNDGKILLSQYLKYGFNRIDMSKFAHAAYLLSNRKFTQKFIL